MILSIYTDGGSKGNPGPASIGIAFYLDKKIIHTYREDLGVKTNNEAEYFAVMSAHRQINELTNSLIIQLDKIKKIQFFSDSSLVVNQLNGLFKVKQPHIRDFVFKIRTLEQEVGIPITYTYIPREKNTVADALVNNLYK